MSWASSLCTLFDANAWRAGEIETWNGKSLTLIPLGYDTMKAQIEITIDGEGNFINARSLNKTESETIVPYPDRRTSGVKALPLCDSLSYIAGDFSDKVTMYCDGETEKKKKRKLDDIEKSYPSYLEGLSNWCSSVYAHPKVIAILKYVSKESTVDDLIKSKVLTTDDAGIISDRKKFQGVSIDKAFVRFRVYTGDTQQNDSSVWLDKDVQRSFISYYLSTTKQIDICFLTGDAVLTAKTNPVKIRGEWDTKASLISSNDNENFTYRGRFKTKDKENGFNEAMSIGYETSQKIHNALKWIIRRQGYVRDGLCIVTWESSLKDMPRFYDSAATIIGRIASENEETDIDDDVLFDEKDIQKNDTNYISAKELNMALDGYSMKLSNLSSMIVMALDSATPGRLALTYYKELATSRYLDNIRAWQESCCWRHEYFMDKHFCQYEGMAAISEVAKVVYGTEQNKQLTLRSNSDGKCPALISIFDRLRPCIIDGKAIPLDIVYNAVKKASNPVAYEKEFNYLRVLHITCSLVKRYYWERGVVFDMKLDEKCTDRSYLFGRLLAVAEKIERSTFERDETRITNAERYMQQFSRTPFRTWELIRRNTQIYLKQLKPSNREYYKNLYSEISDMFKEGAFYEKKALDGRFLLGYDCQRAALKYQKKDGTDKTDEKFVNTEMEEN
ncbi:MAG: type I-C CRISPR-associated protein Cas8c/Csd1 [Clostridiaceae bacterium]|nr:type I-C CRISPR-associated protein Cas8c/Csd1 [Clostridiaceae bacterium]